MTVDILGALDPLPICFQTCCKHANPKPSRVSVQYMSNLDFLAFPEVDLLVNSYLEAVAESVEPTSWRCCFEH